MSTQSPSRKAILDRIRAANGDGSRHAAESYGTLDRSYIRKGALDAEERIKLMIERLREYDADVVECSPGALAATIAAQVAKSGRRVFVVPAGLPGAWLAAGFDWRIDAGLATDEIEHVDGVVTASSAGVADSGTIVLHHTPQEGRRVITLLPDWHLCVLYASQVVETLPEYFARCLHPPSLATYISGPSATADIEMTRIKGVHGPRFLNVIVMRDDLGPKA